MIMLSLLFFFFFNDTATTEIYTLSLHDALPIYPVLDFGGDGAADRTVGADIPAPHHPGPRRHGAGFGLAHHADRKSTRLNSSHANISYAVFCLKKKKKKNLATYRC